MARSAHAACCARRRYRTLAPAGMASAGAPKQVTLTAPLQPPAFCGDTGCASGSSSSAIGSSGGPPAAPAQLAPHPVLRAISDHGSADALALGYDPSAYLPQL